MNLDPRLIAKARRLWAAGVPTKEITAQVGRTKNAIISMARRYEFGVHVGACLAKGNSRHVARALKSMGPRYGAVAEIARRFGVSPQRVSEIKREIGL